MTSPTTLPPGHEIISPDIVTKKPEGMKWNDPTENKNWHEYSMGDLLFMIQAGFLFSAPLGTTAALSTPLPEARCHEGDSCCESHGDHDFLCPKHPRNHLVRVLPGQLKDWKVKPEGLMWGFVSNLTPHWQYYGALMGEFPFRGGTEFAYALPQWSYDEAMGRGEEEQICSVGIIPTSSEYLCAQGLSEIGVEAASNSFATQPESEVKTCPDSNRIDANIHSTLPATNQPSLGSNAAPETSEPFRAAATPSAEEMLDWLEQFKMLEAYQNVAPMSLNFGKWEFRYWKNDCWSKLYIAPILRLAIASAIKEGK